MLIQSSDSFLQIIHFKENIWVSQYEAVRWVMQVRWKIFIQHTILATLPSTYQNLLKLVKI